MTMNNLVKFPITSYAYDFTVPGLFSQKEQLSSSGTSQFPEITYYVDDSEISGIFGSEISPLRLDLTDIAIAVYIADRLSLRDDPKHHKHNWIRELSIKIAVRNLEIWQNESVISQLRNVLNYFTDDIWKFDFVELIGKERADEIQPKLKIPPASLPRVALYSGGLDSFAGAAQQLFNAPRTPFIFVSGATNTRQIFGQRKQMRELIGISPEREIIHQRIGFGIHWNKLKHPKEETSQRTRGFLFITLGAVTALNAGASCLEIYENGIGAINLPYDNSQVGTMSSRAINPAALIRMEKLIEIITGQKFLIDNPYLFQTKGEMCRHEIVKKMGDTVKETFSCDGFPVRTAGKPQCGVCTSCLLRRLSLENAGLINIDEGKNYLTDLSNAFSQPSFNQLNDLRVMEWQYQAIDICLAEENPWQALIIKYPTLQTIVSELVINYGMKIEELQTKILSLYKRYCAEWENFSARENFIQTNKKAA